MAVPKHCTISNTSRKECLEKLGEPVSLKHIANEVSASDSFVGRQLMRAERDFQTNWHYLPEIILMDEVKSTKSATGAMSFEFMGSVAPTSKKLGDAYVYESRVDGAVATFSNVVGTLAQIGITVVAGFLNFAGTVSIGVVVKVNSFIFPIFTGFMTLTNNISNHVSGQKLADKFLAISNAAEQLDLDKTSNNEQVIPAAPAISLNHLSYQFGNKTIAYPDVIIEAGSKVAIMGPSGSGKSTLVKILMNQLPNYQGSITLWGNEVSRIATTEIEDFIGYLPQESHVFNTSVVENVTLYDDALKPELNHVLEEVNMLKTITALPEQSETVVGSNGYPLSGGEKQRLSLARAFIRQKKLLIIDEGTSALDEQNAKEIVSSIMKNKDLTLLMITHTSDRELIKDFDQVLTVG